MAIRECIAYNKDLITGQCTETTKYKEETKTRGIATIELFDAASGEKVYEAKTENIINDINSKMAYMDYFYYKIKGSTTSNYYESYFNTLALFDNNEPESMNTVVIKGRRIGYADKEEAYSGSSTLRGTINENESNLDEDGSGRIHFVFDFPTHTANGTFQKIAWIKGISNTFRPKFKNMDQGADKVLDSQMGLAYRGSTIYQLDGTILRIADINSLENYTTYTLGSDRYQNGIFVTETNIWTVAEDKKVYKYDLNRTLLKTYTLSFDIGVGSGYTGELQQIYIDESAIYLSSYLGYANGSTILKLSLDLQSIIAQKFYEYQVDDIEVDYRRGGFGRFDEDTLIYMADGHRYSLIDKETLEYKGVGTPSRTTSGWAFAQNEEGKNIGTCYKNGVSNSDKAFTDIEFETLIAAETLLASPVTKLSTNTMKIQYTFEVTKVL